jgi:CDK-activating kinase assembly factor MAT1
MKVFNKVEKDFATLREYNDYLEEVENISKLNYASLVSLARSCLKQLLTMFPSAVLDFDPHVVFSIVNEEPIAEECKAKIKQYEEAHRTEIVIRQSHRADEERAIQDRIAAEQREAERQKRDYNEGEKAIALAKRKFKQESTQVLLGEREEVSADLVAAQMQGYRNELRRQREGRATATNFVSPRVREPDGGLLKREMTLGRELYRKRQAAGGGIPAGSIASQERNWNETVSTLFERIGKPAEVDAQ